MRLVLPFAYGRFVGIRQLMIIKVTLIYVRKL